MLGSTPYTLKKIEIQNAIETIRDFLRMLGDGLLGSRE